jgi:hypothetical protein
MNLGDKIDYSQRKKKNLSDLINQTLEMMEQTGGEVKFFYSRMLSLISNI